VKVGRLTSLALRNAAGDPVRTWLLAVCAFAIAAFAVSTSIVVRGGEDSLRLAASRLGADVVVVPRGAATEVDGALLMGTVSGRWMPEADVARIAAVSGVAVASPQIYLVSLSHASCCAVSHMFIVAFDPRTDFTVEPWLHRRLGGTLGLQQAVGGSEVTVPVDRNVMLYGYTMWLRGKLEPTGTNLDRSLFITLPTAYAMARSSHRTAVDPLVIPKDRVSSVMVRVTPGDDPAAVADAIGRTLPGVSAVVRPQMFATYRAQIDGLLHIMLVVLAMLLALSLVIMVLLLSMAAHERRRELGVLRALGASRGVVVVALLAESLVVACAGGLAGVVAAAIGISLFHTLIASRLGIPFLYPGGGVLAAQVAVGLCLAVVAVGIAAAVPALRVSGEEPALAMRE
jgi:putative ABC transport system permease protein